MNEDRLWNKNFIIVCLSNFFLYLIFYLLFTTVAVYASDNLNANTSQAGLATGIFIIGVLIARLLAGRFVDQVGAKKILYIGAVLSIITTVGYLFSSSIFILDIIRLLHGFSLGVAITGTGAIVARIVPESKRGEGIGYFALSTPLGAGVGPLIGTLVTQHYSFSANVVFCILLVVMSFTLSLFLNVPRIEALVEDKKEVAFKEKSKGFSLSNFFEPHALPIAFIALLVGSAYASIISFINTYAVSIHAVQIASFFFLFYAATTAISRPFVGKLFDIKGENVVLYPAFISLAVGLLLISLASVWPWLILLSGVFVGLGYGTFTASGQAIAVQEAPTVKAGLATSTFYILLDGGAGIAPSLLGLFIPFLGFNGLYVIMAIVAIIAGILYVIVHGRKASKRCSYNH
ncbi:MFS transporter [Staphylococcus epidermidis]|nr:MFS transporter [Staphylococcus epidermidis]MBM6336690.1 MFS transporter [Staphylococcus epidermidis]MBM6343426.1 MFS transporter [Staphylococcus epidermidis]MBM6356482.1 MFS transporter [Staphylococcus epidermidis]MBO0391155.1 MFS transporter [Staphylococcus epidermidis]MCG1083396.1 MFS transporter [Staphylococcus epidermidis]